MQMPEMLRSMFLYLTERYNANNRCMLHTLQVLRHTSLEETADSTIEIKIEKWAHQEQNGIVAWIQKNQMVILSVCRFSIFLTIAFAQYASLYYESL